MTSTIPGGPHTAGKPRPEMQRARAARRELFAGTTSSLEAEQLVAQDARLGSADAELLPIGERHRLGAARQEADRLEEVEIGQRAAAQPDEARRIRL